MMRRLNHPWWLHIPKLVALAACIATPLLTRPWPPRPRVYRWEEWAAPIFVLAWLLIFDFVQAERWAVAENGRKRFNRRLLFTSGGGGVLAGMQISICFGTGWDATCAIILIATASMVFLATLLERLRKPGVAAVPALGNLAYDDLPSGSRWVYFAVERSRWVDLSMGFLEFLALFTLYDVLLVFGAGVHWDAFMVTSTLFPLVPFLVIQLLVFGRALQIQVNSERLILRGSLGIRLLRVNVVDIRRVRIDALNPLADFGGWGLCWRKGICAFIFGGTHGVYFETRQGAKFMIGCSESERLAAILRAAVAGAQGSGLKAIS